MLKSLNAKFKNDVLVFNRSYALDKFEFPVDVDVHKILKNRLTYFLTRLFINTKNKIIFAKLYDLYLEKGYNLLHSHNWFSGGGACYLLKKKIGLKYVITIRNTDIYYVWKLYPWFRGYGTNILKNATKIICPTPSIAMQLKKILCEDYIVVEKKISIVPSGISKFWFDKKEAKKKPNKVYKFLFVGELSYNKNIHGVIFGLNSMLKKDVLTIVGGHRNKFSNKLYAFYLKLIKLFTGYKIDFLGELKDRKLLKNLFENADIFIMISKKETFGLTYIEAISQGLPIIFPKNQGVDGFFKEGEVGYSFEKYRNSLKDIIEKIKLNYKNISKNAIIKSTEFSWDSIFLNYSNIYNEICKTK